MGAGKGLRLTVMILAAALLVTGCQISLGLSFTWSQPPNPMIHEIVLTDGADDQTIVGDNGYLRPGETAEMAISLRNSGSTAHTVEARLQTKDTATSTYVTDIAPDKLDYGSIGRRETAGPGPPGHFQVAIDPGTPHATQIQFILEISDQRNRKWWREFSVTVQSP